MKSATDGPPSRIFDTSSTRAAAPPFLSARRLARISRMRSSRLKGDAEILREERVVVACLRACRSSHELRPGIPRLSPQLYARVRPAPQARSGLPPPVLVCERFLIAPLRAIVDRRSLTAIFSPPHLSWNSISPSLFRGRRPSNSWWKSWCPGRRATGSGGAIGADNTIGRTYDKRTEER